MSILEFAIIAIQFLCLVILTTIVLSQRNRKKLTQKPEKEDTFSDQHKQGEFEEKTEKIIEEKVPVPETKVKDTVLSPRESFEHIIRQYFSSDYQNHYYHVYTKLLEKSAQMSQLAKNEIDYDEAERYRLLANDFKKFCQKCEGKSSIRLFEQESANDINQENLNFIKSLQESLLKSVVNSAERALENKRIYRIFKIELEYIFCAMYYFSFVKPEEKEYRRVRKIVDSLCKNSKIEVLVCDIYMYHLKGEKEKIREYIRRISDKEFARCNGITKSDVNELILALDWMGENYEDD